MGGRIRDAVEYWWPRWRVALVRAFGAVDWTPPPWLTSLAERWRSNPTLSRLRTGWRNLRDRARSWVQTHPRQFRIGLLAGLLLLVAVTAGVLWYQQLPKPVYFSVDGTAPGLTTLEDVLKPEPVRVYFGGSAARLDQIGKPVTQGIRISPKIAGEWRWDNDSQLRFTPSEDWAVGQEYRVEFDRKLFPDHVHLAEYEYRFKSAPFSARIASSEFHQDPVDPRIKRVVVTVSFSHAVDTAEFEKRISLRLAGQSEGLFGIGAQSYKYSVSYSKFKNEAYIKSDPVAIPLKDTYMTLAIADGVRAARGGDGLKQGIERQVPIPGMYNFFRIQAAQLALVRNERYEPEQVLVVRTTAGVQDTELQKTLAVYVLPQDLPPLQDQPGRRNYYWSDPAKIGPEVLALSTRLKLSPLPTDREYATLHSFRIQADPGRHVYVRIGKGINSFGGYVLAKDFDTINVVPQFPKELNIMYDGAVLSLNGDKKMTVVSRGIDAVRYEVARVLPGQVNHLVSQSSGQFRNPDFNYSFGPDNITERSAEVRELQPLPPGKSQYSAFDLSGYLSADADSGARRGLFFFSVESWDVQRKRSTGQKDSRLVLVTDLGLIVKNNADGSHDVFVQAIGSGQPVGGATVQVLGKNGVAVVTATSDDSGHARFPRLSDFKREKAPTVYLARRGDDLSFLPYDRGDRQLNFSRFDIGGEVTGSSGADTLDAYLFSDRGVYRPGDEFHIGVIVKARDWRTGLAGIPLEAVVTDARGLEVDKRKFSLGGSGFEEIRYRTEETSPTGNYQASVYIVKDGRRSTLLGSATVRVEEFLPDRLKIATHFSNERVEGWVAPAELKARVDLKNLFGTAATARRVAASVTLSPAYPAFRAYRDYSFFDPLKAKRSFSERLPDGKTDDKGEAEFELGLERFDKATYRVSFLAEGFEAEGGRSVVSESAVLVSPLAYLIGSKPDGDLRYIKRGSERSVELIGVDPALKKTAVAKLKAEVIEQRYVSTLVQQANGTFQYESVRKEIPVSSRDLAIPGTGLKYALPTGKPGDFVLIVRAADDTELNRVGFSVVGEANLTRSLEKNAELQIKLNKTDYSAGDEIELEIKAPYTGAGLITIERDRVYAHQWFRTTTTNSVQRIRVPEGLEGNGYVNVQFVRAMDSPEIFMSPLSYGVVPFSVSRERRINAVRLDVPELARPGEPFRIKVSSQRPGKIVVFAVDEGILQVAKYTTPDPLSHFFKKRALEVQTAQILDLILPEFRMIQSLSAPGGDEEGMDAIGKNLNPFKRRRDLPVAWWSGIIDIDANTRELVYPVPDYFSGSLRVMAVAVSPDSVGTAERKALVRGHFVLSPNAPTFVAPNDEFEVSIGVANNVEGSGKEPVVNLDLATSDALQVVGESHQVLKIGEGRETSTRFKLRAKNLLGSAKLSFTAAMGDKKTRYKVELSVRPPLPYMTTVASGYGRANKVDLAAPRKLYPHYRTLEASASPLPLGLARGLTQYLNKFPYGCTEQLVSQAFPAIVLRARPEFGYSPEVVETSLAQVLRILRARQNAEGAFGFWAANSHVSDFQTVYALHFLTEAREKGYPVPTDVLGRGLKYLNALVGSDAESLAGARTRAYAIYVLTRNGQVTTNAVNSLRSYLDKNQAKLWMKDLTGVYLAASYKMLRQELLADSIIGSSTLGDAQVPDYDYFYDGLVRDAQYLYILARHFPERLRGLKAESLMAVVRPITEGRYNTLSSSYTILGLDAYAAVVGDAQHLQLTMTELQAGGKTRPLVVPAGLFPRVEFSPEAEKVRIDASGEYNVFYQLTQAGFDLSPPTQEIKRKLEVQREYRTISGSVVTSAKLGEELEVHVKLRALDGASLSNVAIVDLLPGGFEVVLDAAPRGGGRPGRPQDAEEGEGEHEGEGEGESDREQASRWVAPIGSASSTWHPEYVDIREDRVVLFGSVASSAREFVYRIKATNQGTFITPPVFAESMYDRGVQARGLGAQMTVGAP